MEIIEEIKNYEIGFLVREELHREDVIKILKNHHFSVIQDGRTLKTKLSYLIKKESFVFFIYLYFSGDPKNIKELDKELKMNSKILRFLIIASSILPIEKEAIVRPEREELPERQEPAPRYVKREIKKTESLSNEALEKKLEEILK